MEYGACFVFKYVRDSNIYYEISVLTSMKNLSGFKPKCNKKTSTVYTTYLFIFNLIKFIYQDQAYGKISTEVVHSKMVELSDFSLI